MHIATSERILLQNNDVNCCGDGLKVLKITNNAQSSWRISDVPAHSLSLSLSLSAVLMVCPIHLCLGNVITQLIAGARSLF